VTDAPEPSTVQPQPLEGGRPKPPGGIIRSSLVNSSLTLVSRIMGFARDLVISYRMGASSTAAADAFNTALAFPNLFRRIFAEGAFAAAFVPAYSKTLEAKGEAEADRIASDAMATLAASTIALTVVAQLTMPWLMYVINPGYADDPEKFRLAILLTQIAMPYLPCMAIYAHLSGVLNARGRFILSAGAPTLLNLVMLLTVWPQTNAIDAAKAASWGVIIAGVAQAGLLLWGVRRTGATVHFVLPRLTPEIRHLIGLAVPGAIAASATQINIFISGILASHQNGARSWLAAADRLYQLPLGLVGVAIGTALLPSLSRAVQSENRADAQATMDQAIVFALALTLPAAAALSAMPFFLIDALFTRGEFTTYDARQTAAALFHYGWGVPAFVLARVLSPAFFARGDTKSPMRFALISVAVNIAAGVALFRLVGFQGIAAATSIAGWVNVGLMVSTLARRGVYRPGVAAGGRLVRIAMAGATFALLLGTASHYRERIEGWLASLPVPVVGSKEVALLTVVAVAGLIYPALLFALRAITPAELKSVMRRRR
jgi:putative peptidoglycan lipid II flippase